MKNNVSENGKYTIQPYGLAIKAVRKPDKFNLCQAPRSQVLFDQDTCQNFEEKKLGLRLSRPQEKGETGVFLSSGHDCLPSEEVSAHCSQLPLNSLEKITLQVEGHPSNFFNDIGATHSTFNSTSFPVPLPWSSKLEQ